MVRKKERRIILWPAYFDSTKTVKEGRKAPKKFCVESPKLKEIAKAASKLGYNFIIDKEAGYPSAWWEKGRVILISTSGKEDSKSKKIKKIAKELREFR